MTTFVVVMLEVILDGLRNNLTFYSFFDNPLKLCSFL